MKDLLLWVKKQNVGLRFNVLDYPEFLNIRVLPDMLKKKVEKELLLFRDDFHVEKIINYMKKESWVNYLDDFFRYTDFFDKSRDQSLKTILPELSSFRNI